MTADTAKEIITEELKNDMPAPLRNAMNMAVTALGVWDHYQDIEYDYKKQGEMLGGLIAYYRKDEKPIHRDGVWLCPACGKKITEWHSYCHICGKKVGWGGVLKRKPHDWHKHGKGKQK